MIQLLFTLLAAEVAMVVVLLFKTPLRKLAILGLDRLKRGRGPVMVKTVAGTILIVLTSSVYSMVKIGRHGEGSEIWGGGLSPTDQVLMSRHLLEASLMGYSLFLALIIDRLHHYIRELRSSRKKLEAVAKQNRVLEEAKIGGSDEIKTRDRQIEKMKEQITQLKQESVERMNEAKATEANAIALRKQSDEIKTRDTEIEKMKEQIAQLKQESVERTKEAKAAESNTVALRKQSEGFLLEYDRLLEDNQNLRLQLQSIDSRLSHSDSKKVA